MADAIDALLAAAAAGDDPAAHVQLGGLLYFTDDFEGARRHWERAFKLLRDAGEFRAAVRVAADLADVHAGALGNASAAQGWLSRARRLLDRIGRCGGAGYV